MPVGFADRHFTEELIPMWDTASNRSAEYLLCYPILVHLLDLLTVTASGACV